MSDPTLVADMLADLNSRQKAYQRARNLYDGVHNLRFATDAFRSAFGALFREVSCNLSAGVVDAAADRLQITGWETEGDGGDRVEAAALALWNRNKLARRSGEAITEALRAGDAYLIVWPDPETGAATIYVNRGHCVTVLYDDDKPGHIVQAVKVWRVGYGDSRGKWRVTVYEEDLITRWITGSKTDTMPEKLTGLVPYEDDYPAETRNEYGIVPVFHLANNTDTGCFGASELRDVGPLQDALNKTICDMLVAMEFGAFQQRVITGLEVQLDPDTGKEIMPIQSGADRIMMFASPDTNVSALPVADVTPFITAKDSFAKDIASVSHTPVWWLTMGGDFPSGESLKTAESPFVSKIRDRQGSFGPVFGEAMNFAMEVDGYADAGLSPIWASAETRSDQDALDQALKKRALGIDFQQICAELGYSPEEIQQMMTAQQQRQAEQAMQFGAAFDRGQIGA